MWQVQTVAPVTPSTSHFLSIFALLCTPFLRYPIPRFCVVRTPPAVPLFVQVNLAPCCATPPPCVLKQSTCPLPLTLCRLLKPTCGPLRAPIFALATLTLAIASTSTPKFPDPLPSPGRPETATLPSTHVSTAPSSPQWLLWMRVAFFAECRRVVTMIVYITIKAIRQYQTAVALRQCNGTIV
jgi:hypothetical protein